jgi:hypothetical protein
MNQALQQPAGHDSFVGLSALLPPLQKPGVTRDKRRSVYQCCARLTRILELLEVVVLLPVLVERRISV